MFRRPRFGVAGKHHPVGGDLLSTDPDLERIPISSLPGLPDRHHDATPVGILGCDRRIHQRRIGDRSSDHRRGTVVSGSGHVDRHKLCRPFAVLHDLMGQVQQHSIERLLERRQTRIVGVVKIVVDLFTGGEQQHGVARGGVGVNGDAVEARATLASRQVCKSFGSTGRSVKTKASIVAMSGAIMPLPFAIPTTWLAAPSMRRAAPLRKVSAVPIALAARSQHSGNSRRCPDERWQFGAKERVRHRLADHPGRRHEYLVGEDAERPAIVSW